MTEPVSLHHEAFPHILESVIHNAPCSALPALRLTSRTVQALVDAELRRRAAHLVVHGVPAASTLDRDDDQAQNKRPRLLHRRRVGQAPQSLHWHHKTPACDAARAGGHCALTNPYTAPSRTHPSRLTDVRAVDAHARFGSGLRMFIGAWAQHTDTDTDTDTDTRGTLRAMHPDFYRNMDPTGRPHHLGTPPPPSGLGTLVNFMATRSSRSHTLCQAARVVVNAGHHHGAGTGTASTELAQPQQQLQQQEHLYILQLSHLVHMSARSVAVLFPAADAGNSASCGVCCRVVQDVRQFLLLPPGGWSRRGALERIDVAGLETLPASLAAELEDACAQAARAREQGEKRAEVRLYSMAEYRVVVGEEQFALETVM